MRSFPLTQLSSWISAACGLGLCVPALGQGGSPRILFSLEYHGSSVGQPSPQGLPYSEGDLLSIDPALAPRLGLAPPPLLIMDGGTFGFPRYTQCFAQGHGPGDACGIELDAISLGTDYRLMGDPEEIFTFSFSVEERAVGHPSLVTAPSVATEKPGGDSSSDIWASLPMQPPPLQPITTVGQHVGVLDGDGEPGIGSFQGFYPGIGLDEPNREGFGLPIFASDEGDNLDAFDRNMGGNPASDAVYFSADGLVPSGGGLGSDTAGSLGALAGDVLVRLPGGQILVYAQASQLGLGPVDDLDALILWENGSMGYQVSLEPYDWTDSGAAGVPRDMLIFSVRAGSPIIGAPDSIFGEPIEPGDLLVPPANGGNTPGIFVPAEALGLQTQRNGGPQADDLDAGDLEGDGFKDCQGNGVEDGVDIALGTSDDLNLNSIPDECEYPGDPYCACTAADAPCGNPDPAGCRNSTGQGGKLEGGGSSSVFLDDFVLQMSQLPPGQFAQAFMGPVSLGASPAILKDGLLCVGTGSIGLQRFLPPLVADGGGNVSFSSLIAYSCTSFPAVACIASGSNWFFQGWYRDPFGPCGMGSNLTNGLAVTFTP